VAETLVSGLSNGGIYGLLAVGIVLVYKGSRALNFAQAELGTFALFVAWWVVERHGQPWLVGALAAVAAVAAIGFVFERVVVRRMGDASRLSVTVATVGLLILLLGLEVKIWGPSPKILSAPIGGLGPDVLGFYFSPTRMLALTATLAIGLSLAAFLRGTDFGLGVLAASQDPAATRLVGVPLARVSAFTWTVAGVIAAIAALLVEPTIGVFAPGLMTTLFVRGLAAALIGGLTSLPGAFVGGIAVGVGEAVVGHQFVQSTFPGIQTIAIMGIIVAVLLVRPQGVLARAAR
jgi:branched-chain amino acid transport system permease protein